MKKNYVLFIFNSIKLLFSCIQHSDAISNEMYDTDLIGILFLFLYEKQKTLLSETAPEESRWPPELILLREKFTAKSQLEIAQLQIKHEEEMSRLKNDYEKQMNRKLKRHLNFDDGRDMEKCVLERYEEFEQQIQYVILNFKKITKLNYSTATICENYVVFSVIYCTSWPNVFRCVITI